MVVAIGMKAVIDGNKIMLIFYKENTLKNMNFSLPYDCIKH